MAIGLAPASRRMGRSPHRRLVVIVVALGALMLASGSLQSGDAETQFQAAQYLCRDGTPSLDRPSELFFEGWDGRYWQAHDVGNLLLMIPAACLAVRSGSGIAGEGEAALLLHAAFALQSMMNAVLALVGAIAMHRAMRTFLTHRAGLVAAVGFVVSTPLVAYARSSWDVLGAAVMVTLALQDGSRLPDGGA